MTQIAEPEYTRDLSIREKPQLQYMQDLNLIEKLAIKPDPRPLVHFPRHLARGPGSFFNTLFNFYAKFVVGMGVRKNDV